MKTKLNLTFLLLVFSTFAYSQIINFPDANFKNTLLLASPQVHIAGSGTLSGFIWTGIAPENYINIDANNDGEIQQSEALSVTFLQISGYSITNLSGLEYFTNLKYLLISNNTITSLNLSTLTLIETLILTRCHLTTINLSNLIHLKNFNCYFNQLTNVDLTGLTDLEVFSCESNQINALNFSGLPNLKVVYCGRNQLSSLDFSGNPLFEDLGCEYNPNLTTIKIKNNKMQLYGSQTLFNQCWGGNPNLNYICADAAEIPALQSFLASCNMTQAITIDSACVLGVEGFEQKEELVVSPNPSEAVFTISFQNFLSDTAQVAVYNTLGQLVYQEQIENRQEYPLVLSGLASGTYILKVSYQDQVISKRIIKK